MFKMRQWRFEDGRRRQRRDGDELAEHGRRRRIEVR
jgi:hypothetical protein